MGFFSNRLIVRALQDLLAEAPVLKVALLHRNANGVHIHKLDLIDLDLKPVSEIIETARFAAVEIKIGEREIVTILKGESPND